MLHLGHMLKELNEESNVYDSESKPAGLWWTSTYLGEVEEDMLIHTAKEAHALPHVDSFKIWDHVFNQTGRMQESVDERMQRRNTA